MMDYSPLVRDAIQVYLTQEFPEFSIQEEKYQDSYCFRLNKSTESYCLRVMFSALDTDNQEDIHTQLEQFSVTSTMRSLGEFPVVLTESGCIFGSP